MWYVFAANSVEHQALFQSGWFIEGLLSQTLVVHMLRTEDPVHSEHRGAAGVADHRVGDGARHLHSVLAARRLVGLQPLPWEYFPWLAATLVSYCVVAQLMKRFYIRRFGEWL